METPDDKICCIVQSCYNNLYKNPDKTFIIIPDDDETRTLWLSELEITENTDISPATTLYVCEDHFDLEHDMLHYWRWKIQGGLKYMKATAVPTVKKKDEDVENKNENVSPERNTSVIKSFHISITPPHRRIRNKALTAPEKDQIGDIEEDQRSKSSDSSSNRSYRKIIKSEALTELTALLKEHNIINNEMEMKSKSNVTSNPVNPPHKKIGNEALTVQGNHIINNEKELSRSNISSKNATPLTGDWSKFYFGKGECEERKEPLEVIKRKHWF